MLRGPIGHRRRIKQNEALQAYKLKLQERDTAQVRETMAELRKEGIVCQGWLTKQGFLFKTWRRRWFVLTRKGRVVYCDDVPTSDTVQLKGEFWVDGSCKVDTGKDLNHIEITTPQRKWQFMVKEVRARNKWYKNFRKVITTRERAAKEQHNDITFLHITATGGIAYRNSPNLDDRVDGVRGPEFGDVVRVSRRQNGWVQLDNGYWIPIGVDGVMMVRDSLPTIASVGDRQSTFGGSTTSEWPDIDDLMRSSFFAKERTLSGTTVLGTMIPPEKGYPLEEGWETLPRSHLPRLSECSEYGSQDEDEKRAEVTKPPAAPKGAGDSGDEKPNT